jgi:hypothetical protein
MVSRIVLNFSLSKETVTYPFESVFAELAPPSCLGKSALELKERIDKRTMQIIEEFMMLSGGFLVIKLVKRVLELNVNIYVAEGDEACYLLV